MIVLGSAEVGFSPLPSSRASVLESHWGGRELHTGDAKAVVGGGQAGCDGSLATNLRECWLEAWRLLCPVVQSRGHNWGRS